MINSTLSITVATQLLLNILDIFIDASPLSITHYTIIKVFSLIFYREISSPLFFDINEILLQKKQNTQELKLQFIDVTKNSGII